MTRACLIEKLIVLPGALAVAELELLEWENARLVAAGLLQDAQEDLWVSGAIDGKNAEIRAAQVRAATTTQRHRLEETERKIARQKVSLNHLKNEHASLRAISRLLGPIGGEMEL